MTATKEQVYQWISECREALKVDIMRPDALQGLYNLYWNSETFYIHGDFDGHVQYQADIAEVIREVADHHGLNEMGMRYISYETGCGLGHQGMGLDTWYKMRRLGLYPHDKTTLLVAKWGENTNLHYFKYWREHFDGWITSPSAQQLIAPLAGVRGLLGLLEDRFVVTRFSDGRYRAYCEASAHVNLLWQHGPVLKLSDDDRQRGGEALAKLGMPPSAWFVTLHVRESPYRDHAMGRNVQVSDYFPAIGEITAAGGWVVRIGAPNTTALPAMPNVIDYAHCEARSDWLDVYLLAACRFFLGTQSGPAQIPPTFGVKSYLTNWQVGFRPTYPTDTAIFKRYAVNGKPLSIREAYALRLPYIESPAIYVPGAEIVPNSPEEIRQLVCEALEDAPPSVADTLRLADYNHLQMELTAGMRHNPAGYCPVGRHWLKDAEERGEL